MATDQIILQFIADGLGVMAIKASAKGEGIVFCDFSLLQNGRISADFLDRLKSAINIQRSEITLILPQRQVIFKYFTLPSKNKDELRRMVGLQAAQGLAFSAQEIVYDVAVAGENEQGSQVVAAISRQKIVEECLSIAGANGFSPARCVVSAFGVAAWTAERLPTLTEPCIVADAQEQGLELCVCRNHQLLFARWMALTEGEQSTPALSQQMDATMEAFKRSYPDIQASKIILTGVKKHRAVIASLLTARLKVPCESVDVSNEESLAQTMSLCAMNGTARMKNPAVDLMPSSAQSVHLLRQEKLALLRVFAALAVLAVSLVMLTRGQLTDLEKQLARARQTANQNKQAYQDARRNLMIYETIASDRKNKVIMANIFKELYTALPPSVVLTNLQYSGGSLAIVGQTKQSADVGAVQKAMVGSSLFTDVTLQYANRPQRLGMELTEFKIVCRLNAAPSEAQ